MWFMRFFVVKSVGCIRADLWFVSATTGENKAILAAAVNEVPINFEPSKKLSVRVMLLWGLWVTFNDYSYADLYAAHHQM